MNIKGVYYFWMRVKLKMLKLKFKSKKNLATYKQTYSFMPKKTSIDFEKLWSSKLIENLDRSNKMAN